MLGTRFSYLCPFGVPAGDKIGGGTRLCLPQRHGAERRRTLRNALISAMVDVALDRGIEQYTGVIPDPFRKDVLPMGWQAEPLGPAVRLPGGPIVAFLVHYRPATPARVRCTGGYAGSADPVRADRTDGQS